jgi:hypothetical protein
MAIVGRQAQAVNASDINGVNARHYEQNSSQDRYKLRKTEVTTRHVPPVSELMQLITMSLR